MINNWPLLQKLDLLEDMEEDYKWVEKCKTDDIEWRDEAICLQGCIKMTQQKTLQFLYWN
jgi:hypothetical protein